MRIVAARVLAAIAIVLAIGCSKAQAASARSAEAIIVPGNALESALLAATEDPARRAEFEAKFLAAFVYIRVHPDTVAGAGEAIGPDGKTTRRVDVVMWSIKDADGNPFIPVFTDLSRLNTVYQGAPWARATGREILKMAPPTQEFWLNPGLRPNVRWTNADVRLMLSASPR